MSLALTREQLTLNAYLMGKESAAQETRSFTVEAAGPPDLRRVAEGFQVLRPAGFQVYCPDEDGELIAFSSDEELSMSMGYILEEFFRIYIKEKKQCKRAHRKHRPLGAQEFPTNVVHPSAICDGYKGPVWISRRHWLQKMRHGLFSPFGRMPGLGLFGSYSMNHKAPQAETRGTSPSPGAEEASASSPQDPNVTFLQNVDESVAAFSPLRIDVDIDVEHGGKRSKVTPSFSELNREKKGRGQPSSSSSSQRKANPAKH